MVRSSREGGYMRASRAGLNPDTGAAVKELNESYETLVSTENFGVGQQDVRLRRHRLSLVDLSSLALPASSRSAHC
jgi:hypothetical protein